ncbi:nitroreductase family protein [Clostridium estertheticum]|uniref:nitroreductase family protein n=1 Tax=Clostridium estertheticum TaxID=238834 RepID=UPI0013E96B46|nr:nitroreductase family protein [Clostridium estertheticum]MBZ9686655.1 nitroreductase family protein [Clostridium estertheticum]
MNETLKLLNDRTSLRKYMDKPISPEDLQYILEGAMRAPTAGNMMTYSIIVVQDNKKKEILSKSCDNQPFIAKAPLVLIFVADYQKWFEYYKVNNVLEYCKKNNMEYLAPSEASLFLAIGDAIIAAQNAVVAAEAIGIGSCYIGDIMEKYEFHKELLKLPEFAFPAAMLCLGYYPEDYNIKPRDRFSQKYVVFNEEYKTLSADEIQDMHKTLNNRPITGNKFNADNYAQMHYAFKTGADFSVEMARSIKEVLKIWNGKKL